MTRNICNAPRYKLGTHIHALDMEKKTPKRNVGLREMPLKDILAIFPNHS